MRESDFRLPAKDGTPLFVRVFLPDGEPKALVQVVHGMAEHSARYARMAAALTEHGYGVYADDHRGHGKTATSNDDLGHFADENGWELVVHDQLDLVEEIKSRHPGKPVYLLGHSMGSFIARCAAIRRGREWAGLLLSGTSHDHLVQTQAGRAFAMVERARLGKRGRSPLIRMMTFDAFNKKIENPRTTADWLSRDNAEVDKYVADPWCGFECTTQCWVDVLTGMIEMCTPASIAQMPRDLPVYVMAGELDPVNNKLSQIRRLHAAFEEHGVSSTTLRVYPSARHELFNETNRDEVTRDLIAWLEQQLG